MHTQLVGAYFTHIASRPSDLRNRNGKRMKPEVARLIEIQPIEALAKFESATDLKGFEALHNIVLHIDDQLLCSNVQTKAGQMYDELWQSFEMFQ